MRKLLILICLLSSGLYGQNKADANSATVFAYWEKGDKRIYSLEKNTEQRSGKSEKDLSFLYFVNIEVLGKTDSSYTISWLYTIRPVPGDEDPEQLLITAPFNNLRIVYTTDAQGSYKELTNMEEMQQLVVASFDTLLNRAGLEPEMQPAFDQLKKVFSSKYGIENILLKDIQLFHSLYGGKFTAVKQTWEAEFPNMFGGDPLPAVGSSQYSGMEKDGTLIKVETQLQVDRDAAIKMLTDVFQKLAPEKSTDILKEVDLTSLNFSDKAQATAQLKSGWIDKLQTERLVSISTGYKKEVSIFSIVQ